MQSEYSADRSKEHPRQQQVPTQTNAKPIALRPQPRKPGWDTDVTHNLTLFDASLKKSLLFQPQAGDCWKDEDKQKIASRPASRYKKKGRTRSLPVQYRSGPSSVYPQHRQSVQHWPQREPKDFVRHNIVRITGRTVNRHSDQSRRRASNRENVMKQLSTPLVSKPIIKSHTLAESARNQQALDNSSPCLSSQRFQQSFSSRCSPPSRSSSTNRVDCTSSRTQHDNYPAQVFKVLDRDSKKRIGVDQILQGLRLLSLPATPSQISDYVYLIHEGHYDSIDLEEWEILVGTLDAASRPSADFQRKAYACQESAAVSRSPSRHHSMLHSPYRSVPPSTSPCSRNHPSSMIPSIRLDPASVAKVHTGQLSYNNANQFSTSTERESIVSVERQPLLDDDPYLQEIQNRIDGMFERAQAAAALHWAPDLANEQFEGGSDSITSNRALNRTPGVVSSCKASLFSLVRQDKTTLRELQQRQGTKLSLFLPPRDMAAIAENFDVLASAILDDILLDMIQLLDEEDRQKFRHQLQNHYADQLDNILTRIHEIEHEEDYMIHEGLAFCHQPAGIECDILSQSDRAEASQHERAKLPNLTRPLVAVMNMSSLDVDEDKSPPTYVSEVACGHQTTEMLELPSFEFETSTPHSVLPETTVNTSNLQGKRLQLIERRRNQFEQHRRLVEIYLAETGMTQCAVIEILEEMLLNDLVEQTAVDLCDTVMSMSDTLLTNLL